MDGEPRSSKTVLSAQLATTAQKALLNHLNALPVITVWLQLKLKSHAQEVIIAAKKRITT